MNFMRITIITIAMFCLDSLATVKPATPPDGFLLDQQSVLNAARSVTAAKYPNSDQVLVDDHVREEYFEDATAVYWDDDYTKILTEKGRRENISHSFHFNINYTTCAVYRAEIIKPDNTVISIDVEKYSKIMTEQGQMKMNIYDPNNKILVLSTPGVEIGDICHIVFWRRDFKARMKNTWADHTVFEYHSPILSLDYEIIAPAALPIKHKVIRDPIPGTVIESVTPLPDGRTAYHWKVRNVPRMFPEPDMPPLHTQVQRLLLSTAPDWKTISRWYWELCEQPMSKITPEMHSKVRELTEGITDYHEKIRVIFKFVSQNIRYMGITTEDEAPGYEPHPVDMTFNNRYGVCRDKAALLVVMLRLAGIPAYPVLIHAGAKMDPDVPVPFFNHAITAADNPQGGYILMDATDENTKELLPAYLCYRSYLVARKDGETLLTSPVYPAEKNMMTITSNGKLESDDSLLLKTTLDFGGINDNVYRGYFLRNKQEKRRKFFEAALKKRVAGAQIIECRFYPDDLHDTGVPLRVELTSRIPNYPIKDETAEMLIMPWLSPSIGYANFVIGATGLDKRKYPMQTDITCGIRESININLGEDGRQPRLIPEKIEIERAGITFSLNHSYTGARLKGELTQKIDVPEFSPEQYLELKEILGRIEAESRSRPLFEISKRDRHDHETLFSETRTVIHTPESWSTTARFSKRILTYAGKKRNSEIKISYNPCWQSVELISATVSNLNGQVHTVTDRELNLMDAAWSASAPRYAAGKTLVVNLPGVETGSVITVKTRFIQTNAAFYATVRSFGDDSPSSGESFELSWPRDICPTIKAFNLGNCVEHTASTNDNSITMRWHAKKPALIYDEPGLPPHHFDFPRLFISFGEWESYTAELRRRIRQALRSRNMAEKLADSIKAQTREPHARIMAIRDEVLRSVRIAGPSFMALPLTAISSADTTLQDQYGHALDRAILLAAVLDEAGFDPDIVFAADDRSRYSRAFQPMIDAPQPDFFANPLVKVKSRGQTYYLNDGDQYSELGTSRFHNAPCLDLNGDIAFIEVPEKKRDRTRQSVVIDIDSNGDALISMTNFFYGIKFGPFRKQYREMLPESRRRHYLELISKISKSAIPKTPFNTDFQSYPGTLSYTVQAPAYAVIKDKTLILSIPEISGAIYPVSSDTRRNAFYLDGINEMLNEALIILPREYTHAVLMPQQGTWKLPCGTGEVVIDIVRSINTQGRLMIRLRRRVKLSSGAIPKELYPALLEYNRIFSHPAARTLVAERP
jgi:hypothetical protein